MQTDAQVTTLLGPTMLGVVGQQCWVRLHEPKVTIIKLHVYLHIARAVQYSLII